MPIRLLAFLTLLSASVYSQTWSVFNSSNSPLPSNSVSSIIPDDTGGVWIGLSTASDKGELVHVRDNQWSVYSTAPLGLLQNFISSLVLDRTGELWIASNELVRLDRGIWSIFRSAQIPALHRSESGLLLDGAGRLWVLMQDWGAAVYDKITWTTHNIGSLVFCGAVDSSGSVHIGGFGLFSFDGTTWKKEHSGNSTLPFEYISSIAVDKDGSLWVAGGTTGNGGVAHKVDTTWVLMNTSNSPLPDNNVLSVCIDKDGNKWFCTSFFGAVSFDGVATWRTYDTTNSGLPANGVAFTTWDKNGNQWFSCRDPWHGQGIAVYGNLPTQVSEVLESFGTLAAYPSAVHRDGTVRIETGSVKGRLRILNTFGQQIHARDISNGERTVLWRPEADIPGGLYFVVLQTPGGFKIARITIL